MLPLTWWQSQKSPQPEWRQLSLVGSSLHANNERRTNHRWERHDRSGYPGDIDDSLQAGHPEDPDARLHGGREL
jgi:hypothetical protein